MLRDKWETRITTYLGMFIEGFPNLIMPNGPQSGSAATNYPRGIEIGVSWVSTSWRSCAPTATPGWSPPASHERWTQHVEKMYSVMLMRKAKSWFTGYNSNVKGHEAGTIRYLVYNGGTPKYRLHRQPGGGRGLCRPGVFDGDPERRRQGR